MRAKNVVIISVGVIVLLAAIVLTAWFLQGAPPYESLILDAIDMRSVGNDSIVKARIIDDMDSHIGSVAEKEILGKWGEITACLNAGCSDDSLFDFMLSVVISRPDKVPNAKLIADVIVAGRFWGSDEVLKFSKALTAANEGIALLNSKELDKKWDGIVACAGSCAEKNSLIFDEVKLIVEKGRQK